jgi:hypothetical protein
MGIVKLRADINTLPSPAKKMVQSLTNNDVFIFSVGTEDIMQFVKTNTHTNIILLTEPHRYNLTSWSCINDEIKVYNRKLVRSIKCYKHVIVQNHDQNRDLYTRHGFRLNKLGKDILAKNIALTCSAIFHKDTKLFQIQFY